MSKNEIKADLCVIGAGSGGLSVAAGAAQLGLKTILIEKGEMGGDCLNTGCVPSKALLAAAKQAQAHRRDDIKGIQAHEPKIDFAAIKDHVLETIATIAPNDSQERFEAFGINVIRKTACFTGPDTIQAGEQTIRARYFVIAAGSRAALPSIPGLEPDKVYTNETIFALREQPEHLIIIGGGPIGIEMAQAHRRLGTKVSVIDMGEILPRDDRENVGIIRNILLGEGIDLYENHAVNEVIHTDTRVKIAIEKDKGIIKELEGSHLLMAAGRTPNLEELDLEKAHVKTSKSGIITDEHLRSTNKRIFAIGDIAGGPQFTHVAGYHAGIVIRIICFKMFWAKTDYKALPWVTYTDPEIAQAGLTEAAARNKYGETIKVSEWDFSENDRAVTERAARGRVRAITDNKGRILGASIVGPHAGELIGLWALAISSGLKISAVAGMIAPYPTLSEASKRAAGAWYTPSLFSTKTRRVVGLLQKLPLL